MAQTTPTVPTPAPQAARVAEAAADADAAKISLWEKVFLYLVLGLTLLLFFVGGLVLHYVENGNVRAEVATLYGNSAVDPSVGCSYQFLLMRHAFGVVTTLRFLQMTVGAILAVIGSMLVLTGLRASYKLRIAQMVAQAGADGAPGPGGSSSLETSSPGLVLITLGVVAMVAALFRTSTLDFELSGVCLEGSSSSVVGPPAMRAPLPEGEPAYVSPP